MLGEHTNTGVLDKDDSDEVVTTHKESVDEYGVATPEQAEYDDAVDAVFEHPHRVSDTTIEFTIDDPHGLELRPGRALAFVVPEDMAGRVVRDVTLRHRKAEKYRVEGSKDYDPQGAYSRVEVHDDETGEWRGWRDPKGYNPDKYAEWRPASDPENEVLHDWLATVGAIKTDAVKVTSVGTSENSVVQVHGVEVTFFPELEGVHYAEQVFTPGTEFIDIEAGRLLPRYGGGSHTQGVYEGAVALNQYGHADFETCTDPGEGVEVGTESMRIDLQVGAKLVQVEVAVGDTEHLSEVNPKTGKPTRLGWAKLSVGIERAETGQVDWFIKRANVPPQGVIAGGPEIDISDIQEGDRLVIRSSDDASYVMGYRLAYSDK
ncbi:hypothetical protein KC973_04080 [Candidatus Saccharibacteria bacterium]|nr:hypothetical protein [Candidatus Saccharibacteria bacterium]